jgi:hypothetical protein
MKHLLILISLLLLSSLLTSCEKKEETLYKWETSSGHKWLGFGEKDTNPKYQGQVKEGKPNGLGYLIHPKGSKYVGEWKNGKNNGQGRFTYTDGRWYKGEWKDGKKNGQGRFTYTDGRWYKGEWKNDKPWNGTLYYINGKIEYKWVKGKVKEQ